ncbi:unnamed protein product [Rhizopus microsporus]|nr:Putative GTPase activating protein [Rhizopus microsporus]
MEQQIQKSFWKRRGLKLPGSVSIVPNTSNSSNSNNNSQDVKKPVMTGNKYIYNSLLIARQPLNTTYQPQSNSKPSNQSPKQEKSEKKKEKDHTRNTSKSFNAFLKDTNDEWSDDITPLSINQKIEPDHQMISPTAFPDSAKKNKMKSTNPDGTKEYVQELLLDPTFLLKWLNPEETKDPVRTKKFKDVLSVSNVDLAALRSLSWSGIPEELRMIAWQLLLGYLPCNSARREATLARKRKEYLDSVAGTYARGTAGLDQALWHQIHIDIPRTNPGIPLYQNEVTQMCLERILYQWAIRHPASGYVQGINDLVTPIFEVFLSAYIDEDPEYYNVSQLNKEILSVIEADSFWCLSKLLDGIQDNYTFAQPGIQRQILTLKELVSRIDGRFNDDIINK